MLKPRSHLLFTVMLRDLDPEEEWVKTVEILWREVVRDMRRRGRVPLNVEHLRTGGGVLGTGREEDEG